MSEIRVQFLSGIFKDDTQSTDKFNCLYYSYNSNRTAFVSKKSRFLTLEEADAYLTTYNATFLSNLANDFDNVTVNSNSVAFTGNDYKFYNLDVTFSSSSSEIDYTNILTSINSNLTNLNTNITNKNNQSEIVQVIKDCFIENIDNSEQSVFKTGSSNNTTRSYGIIPTLLMRISSHLSSNSSYTWSSSINNDNKIFDNISKKLSLEVPNDSIYYNFSIRKMLFSIAQVFLKNGVEDISGLRSSSLVKDISNKLASSNDLHTISQAIDLISTAIAQTPTADTTNIEQGLTEIKESIENKDNVLIVDGEQTFKFRDKDS